MNEKTKRVMLGWLNLTDAERADLEDRAASAPRQADAGTGDLQDEVARVFRSEWEFLPLLRVNGHSTVRRIAVI